MEAISGKLYQLCLGNSSKDFTFNKMIKTGLNRYVYNFSVEYKIFDISDIINTHICLMKKHDKK